MSNIKMVVRALMTCAGCGYPHLPVSSEISDLCEMSDVLLLFSYFASEKK